MAGDLDDFFCDCLSAGLGTADLIQFAPPVAPCVYVRLQGVVLHGKLLHRLNTVFYQVSELFLVSVKLDDFRSGDKGAFPVGYAAGVPTE